MKIKIEALRPDQITEVNEKVEKLLWDQGVVVHDTEVCAFFSEKGAKVLGKTVHISGEMLREAIKNVPKEYTLHARDPEKTVKIGIGNPIVINPNSGMSLIQDADGTRRQGSTEDLVNFLKLNHTSKVSGVSNAGILYPTADIDPEDAKYLQMINALTYSDKPFFSQGIDESYAKVAIELARIATGYRDRHVCMSVANSFSPMAWDNKMLGMIRVFAQENQPINISSSAAIGATAPASLMGALIAACAEGLFGIVYSQLLRPGTPVIFGCFPGVLDMKSTRMSYGSPEFAMLCAAASQMASFYGLPFRGGGGLTSAQVTNAQSGVESSLGLIIALNCELHYMHQSIGTIDSILAGSMEKFVMDEDVIARIKHMQKGMGEIEEDTLDVIQEGFNSGSFLGLKNTVKNFRKTLFSSVCSDNCTYEEWIAKEKSSEEIARSVVKKRLAEYVEPDIGADIKKQMKEYAGKMGANF